MQKLLYLYKSSRAGFRANSIYSAATVVKFISSIIILTVYYFLWKAIYSGATSIQGYRFNELMAYILLTRILSMLYPFGIIDTYSQLVIRGDIGLYLLKPIRMEWTMLGNFIGRNLYSCLSGGIPYIVLFFVFASPYISLPGIGISILFILSAYFFIFLFELNIGVLSIYFTSLWGVGTLTGAIIALLSGELLPISFYPKKLIGFLDILPFSGMYYIPVNVLLGKECEWKQALAIICIVNVLLLVIYSCTSKVLLKKLSISGG